MSWRIVFGDLNHWLYRDVLDRPGRRDMVLTVVLGTTLGLAIGLWLI